MLLLQVAVDSGSWVVSCMQIWAVLGGLVRSLLPEPGDPWPPPRQCCPPAGDMRAEASVSVSLGTLHCILKIFKYLINIVSRCEIGMLVRKNHNKRVVW